MKINAETPTGKTVMLDLAQRTLTMPDNGITDAQYESIGRHLHERDQYYGVQLNDPKTVVILSHETGKKVTLARIKYEDDQLEIAIPGLRALKAALFEESRYAEQFARMMEDEGNDGARPPAMPKANVDELRNQYPRASLYIIAESYEDASNYVKSSAGRKALTRLKNGDDLEGVSKMLNTWHEDAYTD